MTKVKFTPDWCAQWCRLTRPQAGSATTVYVLTPLPRIKHPPRHKRVARHVLHIYVRLLIMFRDTGS